VKKTHSIDDDEAFARKLVEEEKRMISEGAKTKNRLQEDFESGMDDILNDGDLSKELTQLEKDARFAAQLEKIFQAQQQNQIDADEKLAKLLADEENPGAYKNRTVLPPPVRTTPAKVPAAGTKKKNFRVPKPVVPGYQMNKTSPQLRDHAIAVHNNSCTCRNTTAGNNGHIFKIHDQYCQCTKLHMKF